MEEQEQDITDLLKGEYLNVLLKTGKEPITPFSFVDEIGIDEQEFYAHYNTFRALEKDIWADIFLHVKSGLEADSEFSSYSGREKVLSFFYTLVEVYKLNRSLVMFRFAELPRQNIDPWFLEKFKEHFLDLIKSVLEDALEAEEVTSRPMISDRYKDALWIQVLYISRIWVNDDSEAYQTTDAGIEKTVNLAFELMRKGPVDLLIDFAKFAYQNKAY
ncbi:MAG: hypothetical protein JKY54_07570 [Flavobacteriales bacterium]|nr:hypothetical protein [Flavobacteriales bacterium]